MCIAFLQSDICPTHNIMEGDNNSPGVIGGVLGVLIVLVLLLIAILALKLIQMLIRKRRLELHSHREI